MDPPVSDPRVPAQSPAATAAPDPEEEPPQIRWVLASQGFHAVP
jgi:hypothetical protein